VTSKSLFSHPVLYCISDSGNGDPVKLFRKVVSCSVDFFQYRYKHLAEEERFQTASVLAELPRRRTRLLINQAISLVIAVGADGVHLPRHGASIEDARTALGEKLVGISVHSLPDAVRAAASRVDYLLLAPVFSPLSKPSEREPLGLDELQRTCHAVATPVIALGGISRENFTEVLDAGAAGIAGISMFADLDGIEDFAARFRKGSG
jgi:thiamine-phosphate pyrophosphorylase